MIDIDNLDQLDNYSIDQICDELSRLENLDSKRMQNLYLIAVLSNNITKRIENHAKH
jgi:conjugal transfer/entry exclusion protein